MRLTFAIVGAMPAAAVPASPAAWTQRPDPLEIGVLNGQSGRGSVVAAQRAGDARRDEGACNRCLG